MRLLSKLKTGQIIRLHGQAMPAGVVTIGPSLPQEEAPLSQPPTGQSGHGLEPVRQLADAILKEAQQKAQQLEEAGRRQLALWRQQQEDELNRLREEVKEEAYRLGWEQGHANGYQAGIAKAEEEWRQRLAEINGQLQEAMQLKQSIIAEAETEILHLCIALVRKIMGQMVQEQEDAVRQMIRQALRETMTQGRVRVLVHPADLKAAESLIRELSLHMPGESLEVAADPDIQRPGCIIHTEQGIVEATLDAQLDTILQHFLALREKESNHARSAVEVS